MQVGEASIQLVRLKTDGTVAVETYTVNTLSSPGNGGMMGCWRGDALIKRERELTRENQ